MRTWPKNDFLQISDYFEGLYQFSHARFYEVSKSIDISISSKTNFPLTFLGFIISSWFFAENGLYLKSLKVFLNYKSNIL